jgi:hypothetical protein
MSTADTLKKIIEDEKFARKFIENAIKKIKAKDFIDAMNKKLDPSKLILNHLHSIIEQPQIKPLVQLALRIYWKDIESYLTDANKVYNLLCENPELRELLKRDDAKRYLNYAVATTYKRLYEWVWFGVNPYA